MNSSIFDEFFMKATECRPFLFQRSSPTARLSLRFD
jgi:hypothetical protein